MIYLSARHRITGSHGLFIERDVAIPFCTGVPISAFIIGGTGHAEQIHGGVARTDGTHGKTVFAGFFFVLHAPFAVTGHRSLLDLHGNTGCLYGFRRHR